MAEKAWQTYAEAAAALGLSVEGVRQRARRDHWRKMMGNEGKALVMVPEDAERAPGGDAGGHQANTKPETGRAPAKPPVEVADALTGQVAALQERVAELRADLDREREERQQERGRADRALDDLAGMAHELARVAEEGAARERQLHERLAEADRAGRSWWPWKRAS